MNSLLVKVKDYFRINKEPVSSSSTTPVLCATSMDHGLQSGAIYWETGHRTWISFFQPFCHKFTTKLIDDQIRRFFGFTAPVNETSFIFYDDEHRLRYYEGIREGDTRNAFESK